MIGIGINICGGAPVAPVSSAFDPAAWLAEHAVAYWGMDSQDPIDLTGRGNDLANAGDSSPVIVAGKVGDALSFHTGIDGPCYLSRPSTADLQLGGTSAVLVSGAGTSAVNGTYEQAGQNAGRNQYENESGVYVAWYLDDFAPSLPENIWIITYPDTGAAYYYSTDDVEFPWQVTTWTAIDGIAPLPTVTDASTPAPSFLIAGWFKLASLVGTRAILSKVEYTLYVLPGANFVEYMDGGCDIVAPFTADTAWHFIGVRYDADAGRTYVQVDGNAPVSDVSSGFINDSNNFNVGSDGSNFFDGLIDELGIYKGTLSESEAAAVAGYIWNAGNGRAIF
jgi:hypothetical protein